MLSWMHRDDTCVPLVSNGSLEKLQWLFTPGKDLLLITLGLHLFWCFLLCWACVQSWHLQKACSTNGYTWNCKRGAFLMFSEFYNIQVLSPRQIWQGISLLNPWLSSSIAVCVCAMLYFTRRGVWMSQSALSSVSLVILLPPKSCALVQRLEWAWDHSRQAVWLCLLWLGGVRSVTSIGYSAVAGLVAALLAAIPFSSISARVPNVVSWGVCEIFHP